MLFHKIMMGVLVVTFASSLSACGRKNQPIAPDDVEKTYPRTYPAPTAMPRNK